MNGRRRKKDGGTRSRRHLKYFWSNSKWLVRRPVGRSVRIQTMTSKWTRARVGRSWGQRGQGGSRVCVKPRKKGTGKISNGENRDAKRQPRARPLDLRLRLISSRVDRWTLPLDTAPGFPILFSLFSQRRHCGYRVWNRSYRVLM